jgi:hypothetical protein
MGEAQRKAKNEAVFREVNEKIESAAADFGVPGEASFVCECGNAQCTEMVSITLREYHDIRQDGRRFAILPGHEDPAVERVVATTDRFSVVEKVGTAGSVAEALDPRDN